MTSPRNRCGIVRRRPLAVCVVALMGAGSSQAFTVNKVARGTPAVLPAASSHLFTEQQNPAFADDSDDSALNNRHSAADWFYNVRSINQSEILREVRAPVMAVTGWSLVVSVVHHFLLRTGAAAAASKLCIPGTVHSFLVSAIGLLLVFRTNSAYQRFYEGRKIWEDILSVSRNLSRMIQLYGPEVGRDRKRRLLNTLAAFPYLLRNHIRPGCLCRNVEREGGASRLAKHPFMLRLTETRRAAIETRHEGDKGSVVTTDQESCWVDRRDVPWRLIDENGELEEVAAAHNRPLWVCDRIGRMVMEVPYGPNFSSRERLALLNAADKLTNAIGQCERIHQTAVPLNYARHSLRSLTLWLFTLPFALVGDVGLLTAPISGCIAWILFGVYQIGYSIEDPFQGSLRLSNLCDAIRHDVLESGMHQDEEDQTFHTQKTIDEDFDPDFGDVSTWRSTTAGPHYSPLPLIEDKDFVQVTPKVFQENGTFSLADSMVAKPR